MKPNSMSSDALAFVREILESGHFQESSILNLLPVAVYVCDKNGLIVNYNHKAAELWGRIPEKGDKAEDFCSSHKWHYPDGNLLSYQTPVMACLQDGLPRENFEVIIERPDHSQITVRVNIVPIKDDNENVCGVIGCFYDITAEKKAQKELEWRTRQLQDYVENAAIGLHWVDGNGIIKWANKAELDMLGYSEEEYVGHHDQHLGSITVFKMITGKP